MYVKMLKDHGEFKKDQLVHLTITKAQALIDAKVAEEKKNVRVNYANNERGDLEEYSPKEAMKQPDDDGQVQDRAMGRPPRGR